MMLFTKKLYLTMIAIGCMSQTIQSSDVCSQDGKTELMNYVIQQEKEIKIKKAELKKLWNKYFYHKDYVGSEPYSFNSIVIHDTSTLRKICTTDADIVHYRKIEDEYDLLIEGTIENIKIMVLHGANLQARDVHGKSISDYCYTEQIFYALRDLGAPLSLNEQTGGMIILGVLGVATIIAGKMIVTACYDACFPQ